MTAPPGPGRPTPPGATIPRRALWGLAWPLGAELLLGVAVALAGVALAARVSDTAAGAYGIGNTLFGAFFIAFRIVGAGVSVVLTQRLGAGDKPGVARLSLASLAASVWLGIVVGLVLGLFAAPLLRAMRTPEEVLPIAVPYLRVLAAALALDSLNALMGAVLRANLYARKALNITLVTHAVHLAACLPLMRGDGPLPELGIAGFALAMLLSRGVAVALHLRGWQRYLNLVPHGRDWWAFDARAMAPALRIGLPGAAENIAYRLALLAVTAAVAQLGSAALAAHTYAHQLGGVVMLAALALGLAAEILVGHDVGAGALDAARARVRSSIEWGFALSFAAALLLALAGPYFAGLFSRDPQVIAATVTLLWIGVALEPGRTMNVVYVNVLRATGDVRWPIAIAAVSMTAVMAGGSWLLGIHFGLGLPGVWIALAADEWLRGMAMAWRWHSGGWKAHAAAVRH